ncbi:MAG: C39 family peptidase [Lachnospiraceae bacterium]|nr:C39 family peptidase [Lachnospiraceae bacterium]
MKALRVCFINLLIIIMGVYMLFQLSAGQCMAAVPQIPRKMDITEAIAELGDMAGKNKEFQDIVDHRERYPDDMLIALCNNPEMYEFVRDYPALKGNIDPELTDEELSKKCPLLLQWDERWGYASYGNNMVGLSGCGPTCLSMASICLTGDKSMTPDVIAAYSMNNGYYVDGVGTAWKLLSEGASHFGIKAKEIALDEEIMKVYLDRGCPIICSVGPGDFTAAGHFIVIYGYDEKGFKVNDPNCIIRSKESWPYERIAGQIRILWAYSRG